MMEARGKWGCKEIVVLVESIVIPLAKIIILDRHAIRKSSILLFWQVVFVPITGIRP